MSLKQALAKLGDLALKASCQSAALKIIRITQDPEAVLLDLTYEADLADKVQQVRVTFASQGEIRSASIDMHLLMEIAGDTPTGQSLLVALANQTTLTEQERLQTQAKADTDKLLVQYEYGDGLDSLFESRE